MRLPFSYKTRIFSPLLAASLLGHATFFGISGFLPDDPQFAVQKAPSSMEVLILEETDKPLPKQPEESLLLTSESLETVPETKPVKGRPEVKKIQKPLVIPPEKGTLSELDPVYLKNPPPVYPALARERGWEGRVVLHVLVGREGRPLEVRVLRSSGYKVLDQAALKAVERWDFLPARAAGLSFSSWVQIPVRFLLIEET